MQFTLRNIFSKGELTKEELAIKGDKNAFVELISENKLSLYRVARGILKDEHDIEDAIQNTILKSYENINRVRRQEYFKTWLIRILINECNNIIKKQKKVIFIEEAIIQDNYEDRYEDIDLTIAINNLEEDLRVVTVLYYFEDIKQKEIAKILNINENTVRTRLLRARKKLYELLHNDN